MNKNDSFLMRAVSREKLTESVRLENLQANQQGQFTDFQKKIMRIAAGGLAWRDFFIIIGAFFLPVLFVGLIGGWSSLLWLALFVLAVLQIRKLRNQDFEKILARGIQCAVGKYYFDFSKQTYSVEIEDGRKDLYGFILRAKPGTYRFYFVPQLKLALSAEPCDMELVPSFDPETQAFEKILMQSLKFTSADLEANRLGELSLDQQKRLKQDGASKIFPAFLGFVILGLGLLFIFSFTSNFSALLEVFVPALILFACFLLIAIILIMPWYKNYLDIKQGKLLLVTGKGSAKISATGDWLELITNIVAKFLGPVGNIIDLLADFIGLFRGGSKGDYFIGKKKFHLAAETCEILGDDTEYTAYYLPNTKKLVAVEQAPSN